ncbi:MAG: hypothetical protein ACRC8A_13010, partial [Microcoleaceae cyanobacterium]
SYSGDTTDGPIFNRPAAPGFEGVNNPITSLSSIGTAVNYFSQQFSVDATGSYDVAGVQDFDGLQFLYQTGFDPEAPLTNLLSGSDSFPEVGNSGFFDLSLMNGTQYFLVTTGFENPDSANISFGTFTNTITGPGNITLADVTQPVPEPSSVAGVVVFGLLWGGFVLKRSLNVQP